VSAVPRFTNWVEQPRVPPPFVDILEGTRKQLADRLEQPRVPPRNEPYLLGALRIEQPTKQPRPLLGMAIDSVLKGLEGGYVIDDRLAVHAFIRRNRLRDLLQQAREPLNAAFGEGAVKKLTLAEDDEGFTTLFCLILVPGDMVAARLALKSFDEHWWLARSGQARGKLNFDFELI
jgi:hypothetical protein